MDHLAEVRHLFEVAVGSEGVVVSNIPRVDECCGLGDGNGGRFASVGELGGFVAEDVVGCGLHGCIVFSIEV